MDENRTMIAGADVPLKANAYEATEIVVEIDDEGKPPKYLELFGEQYARLPEAWPAAGAGDLEEAHAEAVASGEPEDWEKRIADIYASFTPEEVQELCEDWVRLAREVTALRKGMKTMQRKTRKQSQVQRRLERRLAQARAGREQLRHTASLIAQRKIDDAAQALLDTLDKRGVVAREAGPQAISLDEYFEALSKEPRSFA